MMIESYRTLGFISKTVRLRPIGVNKFFSTLPEEKQLQSQEQNERKDEKNLVYKYPEFFPLPDIKFRNPLREMLERREMLKRRSVITIPEFYVGTIMAVTSSNKHAEGKTTRFVGICIMRKNWGLLTTFILRNVIEHQGVEVMYTLYSPLIQKIEVLKLEKRLDDELFYLRDAPHEYSTFPFDMLPEYHMGNKEVPVNPIKVQLNPRPWLQRYERMDLKGVIIPPLSEKIMRQKEERATPWVKYDIMDKYRNELQEEDKYDILSEISEELKQLEVRQKKEKKVVKETKAPPKQKLF